VLNSFIQYLQYSLHNFYTLTICFIESFLTQLFYNRIALCKQNTVLLNGSTTKKGSVSSPPKLAVKTYSYTTPISSAQASNPSTKTNVFPTRPLKVKKALKPNR